MKPYVICHSMGSVDGRIQATKWPFKHTEKFFEGPADKIKVDAWIVGRKTMQEFSSHKSRSKAKIRLKIPRTDFIGDPNAKAFAVGIDPDGKCYWDGNKVSTEHVIEVLTEKVGDDYLHHLQQKKVSYIFAGKERIHLPTALEKLNQLFGIKKVRIDGGGSVNGSFLKAGLIDELSLILVPVADGAMNTPSVFDAEEGHTQRMAKKLRLISIKKLKSDVLWLRYRVKN